MKTIRTLAASALLACLTLLALGGTPASASPVSHHALKRSVTYCGAWDRLWVGTTKRLDHLLVRNCFRIDTRHNGSARMTALFQAKVSKGVGEKLSIQAEWFASDNRHRRDGDNGKPDGHTIYPDRSTRVVTYTLGSTSNVVHKGNADVYVFVRTAQKERSGKTTKAVYYGVDDSHSYAVSSKRR